jgi:hypothetical protein
LVDKKLNIVEQELNKLNEEKKLEDKKYLFESGCAFFRLAKYYKEKDKELIQGDAEKKFRKISSSKLKLFTDRLKKNNDEDDSEIIRFLEGISKNQEEIKIN